MVLKVEIFNIMISFSFVSNFEGPIRTKRKKINKKRNREKQVFPHTLEYAEMVAWISFAIHLHIQLVPCRNKYYDDATWILNMLAPPYLNKLFAFSVEEYKNEHYHGLTSKWINMLLFI